MLFGGEIFVFSVVTKGQVGIEFVSRKIEPMDSIDFGREFKNIHAVNFF